MEYVSSARNGFRLDAREAHDLLDKSMYYDSNFKDATTLQEEMYDLGTTHMILRTNPGSLEDSFAESLYESILDNVYFPYRKNWQVIHLVTPEEFPLHYELEWVFDNPVVSFNNEDKNVCEIEKEVQDGFTEEEVWSQKDSAYVIEQTPKYKTIEVEVTTFEQYKSANMDIHQRLINLVTKESLDELTSNFNTRWCNTYSKTSGDQAAWDASCPAVGGSCTSYPNDDYMLTLVAKKMQSTLLKQLDDPVD